MSIFQHANIGPVTIIGTNETVIATISGVTGSPRVLIFGNVAFLTGPSTTAIRFRLRYGVDTSGAIVQGFSVPINIGAAMNNTTPFAVEEPGGWFVQYPANSVTLTAQQTAATGNGSVTLGDIGLQGIPE